MTAALLVLGTAQGAVGLLDEALGSRLRPQLRRHGVAYLPISRWRRAGSDPATALRDELAVTRASAGRRGATVTAVVTAEVPGLRDTAAVAAGVVELLRGTVGGRVLVRLVVERQDRLAEHAEVDALRTGAAASPPAADVTVDFAAEADALAAVPGVAGVTARPYELVGSGAATWIDGLLGDVGLRGRVDLRPLVHGAPIPRYRTLSATGLDLGRALVPELVTSAEREELYAFLLETFPADPTDRLLPPDARAAVVAAHRATNAAFLTRHAPDLPPDSYADDDATALLSRVPVPVRVPPPPPQVALRRAAGRARRALRDRVRARD